jgi:putative transposase
MRRVVGTMRLRLRGRYRPKPSDDLHAITARLRLPQGPAVLPPSAEQERCSNHRASPYKSTNPHNGAATSLRQPAAPACSRSTATANRDRYLVNRRVALVGAGVAIENEVWTVHGLITYYTLFIIDLASRRVQILGSTPHPDALFMHQITRALVFADDGTLARHQVVICGRDAKWSHATRDQLADAGVRVVQTPYRAPNANAHAERFVRSIKEECLHRIVSLGERHFRRAVTEYVLHYHGERPHQGRGNNLLERRRPWNPQGPVRRRPRLGGLLNFYARAA